MVFLRINIFQFSQLLLQFSYIVKISARYIISFSRLIRFFRDILTFLQINIQDLLKILWLFISLLFFCNLCQDLFQAKFFFLGVFSGTGIFKYLVFLTSIFFLQTTGLLIMPSGNVIFYLQLSFFYNICDYVFVRSVTCLLS